MRKFVLEKSLSKDAPAGYHFVKQSLGFTTTCEACGAIAKALSFFRCCVEGADSKNMLTKYEGGMTAVCSVACYRTTADYLAENTLQSHNDRIDEDRAWRSRAYRNVRAN